MLIKYKDDYLSINLDLVANQNIDFDTMCEIVALHKERYDLRSLFAATKDKTLIRMLFVLLRNIEFELQILWGFEPNESWHGAFRWPHCTCPKWDNREAYPHYFIISGGCPLHGADLIPDKV